MVSDPFPLLVKQYAPAEIAPCAGQLRSAARQGRWPVAMGLGAAIPSLKRSPYDDFMMRFHNFLKENARFRRSARSIWQFPAGSSWMVYTDMVPHAVLAGQYALEQTFLVAPEAMVTPETSPLKVLQGIAGTALV